MATETTQIQDLLVATFGQSVFHFKQEKDLFSFEHSLNTHRYGFDGHILLPIKITGCSSNGCAVERDEDRPREHRAPSAVTEVGELAHVP